jgi:hypothetical protein
MRQIRSLVSLMNGLPIMITHVTHVYADLATLDDALRRGEVGASAVNASTVLVQIYSASNDRLELRAIMHQVVLGFTFFESSTATVFETACVNGCEMEQGVKLGRRVLQSSERVVGMLLLASPVLIGAPAFLRGLESVGANYALFGGGAGEYSGQMQPLVFSEMRSSKRA